MSVEILRLGHRGDGIAEGPVFVPRTLPGEIVEGEQVGNTITAPRILSPSDARVKPPCRHYNGCGGCALLHASDSFVANWKIGVVRAALDAHGIEAAIRGIETSPPETRRRAKFTGRRTKKGAIVGFHGRQSDVLTAIPDCRVLLPELRAAIPMLEALVAEFGSRKAPLAMAITHTVNGPDLAVDNGKPLDEALRFGLTRFAQDSGLARLSWNGELVLTLAEPAQRFDGIAVTPPPGAFLQATRHGEDTLRALVEEATIGAGRIADLFAGCGTFALPLARRTAVHAVEAVEDMLGALDLGWRYADGLHAVSTETRDLFRRPMDKGDLQGFDTVVIDPPRAGAEAQCRELALSDVLRVAFVSCNPVTFARDAKLLIDGGFRLNWITVVDQFRWSAHVELAASFTRTDMSR